MSAWLALPAQKARYLAALAVLLALPALAISAWPTEHRECVRQVEAQLRGHAYRNVPERAGYAADAYCRRRAERSAAP